MRQSLAALAAALLFVSTAPLHAQQAASPVAEDGKLAYYGSRFAGRKTANGERFNPQALTMAHKTLPFGTLVRVTNPANQRSVVVRVNDRGPSTADRVGDLSPAAARQLRMTGAGVVDAKLEVVGRGKRKRA
ncbi:septal ring lytic transglycosylase RlpA family protein [Pseudorhodoferax sp. Leaf267]|uniref:septal ring lytic transglycosylase RlpA family protein n=1 Tax=Pseudorhodoferax sp. Leaf267 TaxID=1736316 RepID=UPI0006F9E61D|nr:septal ring lytic transglycosylase RlpA family protein [Pseudorhodoferax sp. Leaf267]KQP21928.1 hypothetical protein ASF43_24015 [Pseudorhodoferax sp. Leaf267]